MISGGSAGLMMMIALPLRAPPDLLDRRRGRPREFVDILARSWPGRFRRDRRDNLAVRYRLDTGDGGDHGNRRLTTASHHIDVHHLPPEVRAQIDRRHTERPDRRRRQIDHQHAARRQRVGILAVHIGRGRIEGNLDVIVAQMRQQPGDALIGRLSPISRARCNPSDCGSTPTIHTGSSTVLRLSFIIRSVPILPEPINAQRIFLPMSPLVHRWLT